MTQILVPWTKDRGRPFRLVGGVGILLGFQADGGAVSVCDAALALYGTVEEVAGVNLYAGFVGIDLEVDAGLLAVEFGSRARCVSARNRS